MGILLRERSGNTGRPGRNGKPRPTPNRRNVKDAADPSRLKLTTRWRKYTSKMQRGPGSSTKCVTCGALTLDLFSIQGVDRVRVDMCVICTLHEFEYLIIYLDSLENEKCQTSRPK